jgi:hypothetical protein
LKSASHVDRPGRHNRVSTACKKEGEGVEDNRAQQEASRQQNLLIYGGVIGICVVLVQQFVDASSLDLPAMISVVAIAVSIPVLGALVLLSQLETLRGRTIQSRSVDIAKGLALTGACIGVVAAFWHILWPAGVAIMVGGVIAVTIHSIGYTRLIPSEGSESR